MHSTMLYWKSKGNTVWHCVPKLVVPKIAAAKVVKTFGCIGCIGCIDETAETIESLDDDPQNNASSKHGYSFLASDHRGPSSCPDGRGVTILGPTNIASEAAYHASLMFGNNVTKFLQNMVKAGQATINIEDEIVRETMVTRDGQVVHPKLQNVHQAA